MVRIEITHVPSGRTITSDRIALPDDLIVEHIRHAKNFAKIATEEGCVILSRKFLDDSIIRVTELD